MTAQKIMWIALPNGFHEGSSRLSVFVSPRLTSDTGRLDEFPDFVQWAERVNAMSFTVETESAGAPMECRRISQDADPEVWGALFRADTEVERFEVRDYGDRVIRTMPVRSVTQYLSGLYSEIATASPDVLPRLFHEDDEDGDGSGTLGRLLRDVGTILPVEVADAGGILDAAGVEAGNPAASLFSLPQALSDVAPSLQATPVTAPQLEELKQSVRFTALDETLREVRVLDTRADETHGFASKPALDFFQAHRFYDRPDALARAGGTEPEEPPPPPPEPPKIDFHKMLSLLGDHPYLMRKLGVVVDLVVESLPPEGRMRVRAHPGESQPLGDTTHVSPWTAFRNGDGLFVAATQKDEVADGMLRLDDANDDPESTSTDYDLIQVDVDGAALKTVNLAVTAARGIAKDRVSFAQQAANVQVSEELTAELVRPELARAALQAAVGGVATVRGLTEGLIVGPVDVGEVAVPTEPAPAPPPPERSGLPPMRSAGIAVARAGRAAEVAAKLEGAAANAAQPDENEVVHHADDLVRGYRIDVFDDHTGEWHSLCRRIGRYELERADGSVLVLEGPGGSPDVVEEGYVKGATTTSNGEGSDLYLHETMFRWDGWSLAAPRPGRTIRGELDPATGRQREVVERPKPQPATQFKMTASFRAEPGTLPRLRFGHTYKVRARLVDLAGNSLGLDDVVDVHASEEITYVRFDPVVPPLLVPRARFTEGESLNRMVIRSNYDASAKRYSEKHPYSPSNDRHVVPPKTSQQMAESHGAFDEWMGKGRSHREAFELSVREAGALDHTHVVVGEDDVGNPVYEPLEGSEHVPGRVAAAGSDGAAPGGYVINTKERFPLVYLPDPPAEGVVLIGLPGLDEPFVHRYEGEWPDRKPFVIRVVERKGTVDPETCVYELEGPGEPRFADGVLTVPLPKGAVATVRYGSLVDKGEIERMGQQRWLRDADGISRSELVGLVERGDHWMFTPKRELILVHAVQQPLCPPAVVKGPVQGRTEPQPLAATYRGLGDTFATFSAMLRLDVATTGQVDLRASWKEPKDLLSEPTCTMVEGASLVAAVPVDARLRGPDVPFPFPDMDRAGDRPWKEVLGEWERLFSRPIRHEFGDTKHRWVDYRLVGTSRFREYFPPDLTADPKNLTREGPSVRLNVLSSARPDAPRVDYVVPSFRWEESLSEDGGWKFERKRVGGGLRVYLHRPWFSSGEGELLGVVLWGQGLRSLADVKNERLRSLVSMFGKDPIWASGGVDVQFDRSFFAPEHPQEDGLSLDETSSGGVGVVGFAPEFDEERKMWFCDVELGPKAQRSYYPFVRLALARYQPDALPDAKVSRVVQTDFAQVVPNRTLTVTKKGGGDFDVTVHGPAPDAPHVNRVEVELQVHDGRVAGDLGWRTLPSSAEQPNPVILRRGFPDAGAASGFRLPEKLLEGRIFAPPVTGDAPISIPLDAGAAAALGELQAVAGEAGAADEVGEAAIEAGSALQFARPVEAAHLPVVDATGMLDLVPEGTPADLVSTLPVPLLHGYETWSGSVTVPEAAGKVRLLVCEFEHYAADDDVGKLDRDEVEPKIEGRYLDRVVYADTVELPV